MKTHRKTLTVLTVGLFMIMFASSPLYGAAGGEGSPWYPNDDSGICGVSTDPPEYVKDATLYIIMEDTGKKKVAGKVGNQADDVAYREFVVEISFVLEIETDEGLEYYSGIGKTCEDSVADPSDIPICPEGAEGYYDQFYLPGDYATRIGAAMHSFLVEVLGVNGYVLCPETNNLPGTGNAEDVVDPFAELPGSPWFYVQPLKIIK